MLSWYGMVYMQPPRSWRAFLTNNRMFIAAEKLWFLSFHSFFVFLSSFANFVLIQFVFFILVPDFLCSFFWKWFLFVLLKNRLFSNITNASRLCSILAFWLSFRNLSKSCACNAFPHDSSNLPTSGNINTYWDWRLLWRTSWVLWTTSWFFFF